MSEAQRQIQCMPQSPQVQYSVEQQLQELHAVARKLGLYAADDYLGRAQAPLRLATAADRMSA